MFQVEFSKVVRLERVGRAWSPDSHCIPARRIAPPPNPAASQFQRSVELHIIRLERLFDLQVSDLRSKINFVVPPRDFRTCGEKDRQSQVHRPARRFRRWMASDRPGQALNGGLRLQLIGEFLGVVLGPLCWGGRKPQWRNDLNHHGSASIGSLQFSLANRKRAGPAECDHQRASGTADVPLELELFPLSVEFPALESR